jgi:hypothetical protein
LKPSNGDFRSPHPDAFNVLAGPIYSIDKKLFYISGTVGRVYDWLSIEKDPKDGRYVTYPFMMYEIRSFPEHEAATEDHPLVKLYKELFPETGDLRAYAFISTPDDDTQEVGLGDWVIKTVNGDLTRCKADAFEQTYEPAQ